MASMPRISAIAGAQAANGRPPRVASSRPQCAAESTADHPTATSSAEAGDDGQIIRLPVDEMQAALRAAAGLSATQLRVAQGRASPCALWTPAEGRVIVGCNTERGPEMSATWPDPRAAYERPRDDDTNTRRWQGAVDAAIDGGRMDWRMTSDDDIFVLTGACPRCAHDTEQSVERKWIRGLDNLPEGWVRWNFDCACNKPHRGRPEDAIPGCGWGGPIAITSKLPGASG